METNTNDQLWNYQERLFGGWQNRILLAGCLAAIILGLASIMWDMSASVFPMTTGDGVGTLVAGIVVALALAILTYLRMKEHNDEVRRERLAAERKIWDSKPF